MSSKPTIATTLTAESPLNRILNLPTPQLHSTLILHYHYIEGLRARCDTVSRRAFRRAGTIPAGALALGHAVDAHQQNYAQRQCDGHDHERPA